MVNKGIAGKISELQTDIKGEILPRDCAKIKFKGIFKFEWILNSSFQLSLGDYYESPEMTTFTNFGNKEIKWSLAVYPGGKKNKDSIAVYLACESASNKNMIKCRVSIILQKNSDLIPLSKHCLEHTFIDSQTQWGWPSLMQSSELNFDPCKDKISVICEIEVAVDIGIGDVDVNIDENNFNDIINEEPLLKGYQKLFNNELFSDVAIVVDGSKIAAHRNILAAHSEVFLENLSSVDSNEKNKSLNVIEIKDISYETIEQMIKYIYCERVENVSLDLLTVADKYKVNHLKHLCEVILSKSLSVNNVIESLTIANDHRAEILKCHAKTFILNNANIMLKPPFIHDMLNLNKKLLSDLLGKMADKL